MKKITIKTTKENLEEACEYAKQKVGQGYEVVDAYLTDKGVWLIKCEKINTRPTKA